MGVVEPLDLLFSMNEQEDNSFDSYMRHHLSCTYGTLTSTPKAKCCSYELIYFLLRHICGKAGILWNLECGGQICASVLTNSVYKGMYIIFSPDFSTVL